MSLATSYARALYESATEGGSKPSDLDALESQMDAFLALLNGSHELRKALYGPVITSKDKVTVIETLAKRTGYATLLQHFLVLLAQKERLIEFSAVREAFTAIRLEAEGGVSGRLVSAEPLSDTDVKALADAFSKKLGKKVAFRVSADPALLAGVRATINGVTYDGSLRSQLHRLRDAVVAGHAAS